MRGKKLKIIDTHVHSIFRPTQFFENYRLMGVETLISVAYYPVVPNHSETLEDLFRWLIELEPKRLQKIGISGFCGIGIHPRSIPKHLNPTLYSRIEEYSQSPEVVCLGEIGLEKGSKEEVEVLEKQLDIAINRNLPVILHTPGKNKREMTRKLIEILDSMTIRKIVIDHVTLENIDLVLNTEFYIGLTVQLGKLSLEDFLQIIRQYGDNSNRFILNSDLGIDIAQDYIVPKAVNQMFMEKIEELKIESISHKNAELLFQFNK
jgi:predicted metal-dependent TIM-barrel fold hydrolase